MQLQNFSCRRCLSFSIPVQPLVSVLEKITEINFVAEIIVFKLKERTIIDPWYFDLLDKPPEIREKIIDDDDYFYDIQDELKKGTFSLEGEEVVQYPFDECVFVFDTECTCKRIMRL